jgi:hypothetical protein
MVNEVSDEVVGFGPIEFLLQDPEVTEVAVRVGTSAWRDRIHDVAQMRLDTVSDRR